MTALIAEFDKVLEDERAFALRADVDGLASIQEEKRAALARLLDSGVPASETYALREKALSNVQLIRHLVACLQGLSASTGPTYDASGGRPLNTMRRSWGSL